MLHSLWARRELHSVGCNMRHCGARGCVRCAGGDLQLPSAKALARQLLQFKASLVSLDLRGTYILPRLSSAGLYDGRSACCEP
jgi:hypothetical protein